MSIYIEMANPIEAWSFLNDNKINVFMNKLYIVTFIESIISFRNAIWLSFIIPPPQNVGGGLLYWIRFVPSIGRSVCPSVSNSCPLYNSFTNGRISVKLEWHIHLN